MPRMKWANSFDGLPDDPDDWSDGTEDYDGPEPKGNLVLSGDITKMWATTSQAGNDMIKVLFVASGNTDDRKKYNGWVCFDNITFADNMAWRYGPFLDVLDVGLADVERRTVVGEEENPGFPILKIGPLSLKRPISGRIKTKIERSAEYGTSTKIGKWLLPKDAIESDDDGEEEDWDDEDDEDQPF